VKQDSPKYVVLKNQLHLLKRAADS
jgi:hypothetical protein